MDLDGLIIAFEVAMFDPHGNFATFEILQIDDDDVGWQGARQRGY